MDDTDRPEDDLDYSDLPPATAFELAHLRTLTRAVWPRAVLGDDDAVARVCALTKRRTDLLESACRNRPTPAARFQDMMNAFLDEVLSAADDETQDIPGSLPHVPGSPEEQEYGRRS